jgi:hypothetical protein
MAQRAEKFNASKMSREEREGCEGKFSPSFFFASFARHSDFEKFLASPKFFPQNLFARA